jgi:methyl-accepting chemotaxis protein
MLKHIQFTTKLFVSVVLISVVSILITSGNAIRMSNNGLYTLGEESIKDIHQAVSNSLQLYEKNVQKKLEEDLQLFRQELRISGEVFLDKEKLVETAMINQKTMHKSIEEIPQLRTGSSYINGNFRIVDNIKNVSGSSATIFQFVDDKLLRISTTIKNNDGKRAVGTYIPSTNEVYKTVLRGEVFRGKAYVMNEWLITEYTPLRDSDNTIVGAFCVAQLMLNPKVKDFINKTKIGHGYFFVYNQQGNLLVHPTLDSTSNLFEIVPEFTKHKQGFLYYPWKGETKVAYTDFIEEWGFYLAVGINQVDIIAGLDKKMLRNNLLVGLLVISVGIFMTFILVQSINKPLKELAEKSFKVGEGDYTINFSSNNKDAIGRLTNSLGQMITKSKEMLQDIIRSSQALASASTELATISEHMVTNADSTTEISEEASGNATEVSDNMNSVSAAMEQSTVNLDTIASASEDMGQTINEIAENSARARITTEEAVISARKSHEGVQELGESARSIGTVTETITEISEQTNLLALNATIEAARAGEAGKGFAVVANEIKELAKETASATNKIKSAIEEIQSQTGETIHDIEAISTVINDVNEIVTTIVTSVEEQSITTNEIVNNVSQASQGIAEINENVANSSQMTSQMSQGVERVKTRSIEVKENSQQIRHSADELSDLSQTLTALVSRFKI